MKIAATVVTFNRKDLLKECIESLLLQTRKLDEIIIIDNASSDGTDKMMNENFAGNEIVTYIQMEENLGGAGGFHEGIKKAYENNHDWIWIMDDDCEVEPNSLKLLINNEEFKNETAALSNFKIDEDKNVLFRHASKFYFSNFRGEKKFYEKHNLKTEEAIEIDYSSFIGILVNRKAVEKIGYPEKKLFLQYDDVEYSFRLNSYGKIFLVPQSILIHKEKSNFQTRKLLGKTFHRNKPESVWKEYYGFRNISIFFQKGLIPKWRYINFFIYICKSLLAVLLIDSDKKLRFKMYIRGVKDGIIKNYGKTVLPGEK